MKQHVTLTLPNGDDFGQLLSLIHNSGFPLIRFDENRWEVEAYVDPLILCIAERYLDAAVLRHVSINRPIMYSAFDEALNAVA